MGEEMIVGKGASVIQRLQSHKIIQIIVNDPVATSGLIFLNQYFSSFSFLLAYIHM